MCEEDSIRLNKEILKEAVINYEKLQNVDVEIIDYKCEKGCEEGENFMCTIYRVIVKAFIEKELKEYDFIAKVIPVIELREKMIRNSNLFEIEKFVYTKLAPKLKEYGNSKQIKIQMPECYYVSSSTGVLILENLKCEGFKMVDKKFGLDEVHLNLALKELAHLHALTYHYLQIEGIEILKQRGLYRDTYIDSPIRDKLNALSSMLNMVSIVLEKNEYPELAKKMNEFLKQGDIVKIMERDLPIDPSALNVILHGDCWSNNFLFKYNENGNVSEMKFVDFQTMRVNRPPVDVIHMLYTCTTPSLREKEWKNWLKNYYDTFVSDLAELGYNGSTLYPLTQCERDFQRARTFGFLWALLGSQRILTDATKEGDFDLKEYYNCKDMEQVKKFTELTAKKVLEKYPIMTDTIIQLVQEADKFNIL